MSNPPTHASATKVGTERQLFLDERLIERCEGSTLRYHTPTPREVVLTFDRPWEGRTSWAPIVFRDEGRYRLWYRASGPEAEGEQHLTHNYTGYAESQDGVCWERPNLEQVRFDGQPTNICIDDPDAKDVAVFKDPRSNVPDSERYKVIGHSERPGRERGELHAKVSADGLAWEAIDEEPIIVAPADDPQFDSPVNAFWDPNRQRYVVYTRGWYPDGPQRRIRAIRMATSPDFRDWSDWEYITVQDWSAWQHHLYTNAAHRYYRAPYYLMYPKRFFPDRMGDPEWSHAGLSDVLCLASRDGRSWTQVGDRAFIAPGLDQNNWHDRAISVGPNTVPTGDGEMSIYSIQNYRTDDVHLRRFTMREDGFVSVTSGARGGVIVTTPIVFEGGHLDLNYATSAGGVVRVGLLDGNGEPIPGYTPATNTDLIGDEIDARVEWSSGDDLTAFAGKPVRLRFEINEADLYAFRFAEN